jgi:hypothetical protein
MPVDTDVATTTTATETFTATLTIDQNVRPDSIAIEFRKIRDAFNYVYRAAMITHNTPVYHPLMQGLAACAINLEQMINTIDPPRVVPAGQSNHVISGTGRA